MHPRAPLLSSLTFALTLGWIGSAQAVDPSEKDPRKIAQAVEDRPRGDRGTMVTTLTLEDGSGRQRVRKLRQQAIDFAGGTKTLMFFEAPADVRNTGLLSIDYDDGKKEDDQWLYLPSQHKSTRIATADKSGSFMGTDITYADMTKKDIADYDYTLVEASVKVGDEDCWLIEARPKTEKEKKETGYLKTHTWISKSKLMPVQMKAWVIEGKKLKYLKFTDLKQVDGIWLAGRLAVRTMRGDTLESQTTMEMQEVKFNQATVTEDQFSERRLEQGL